MCNILCLLVLFLYNEASAFRQNKKQFNNKTFNFVIKRKKELLFLHLWIFMG